MKITSLEQASAGDMVRCAGAAVYKISLQYETVLFEVLFPYDSCFAPTLLTMSTRQTLVLHAPYT